MRISHLIDVSTRMRAALFQHCGMVRVVMKKSQNIRAGLFRL